MTMARPDICPYCRFPIAPSEPTIVCPKCQLAHHKECWEANRGCTTYGCDGRQGVVTAFAPDEDAVPTETLVVDVPSTERSAPRSPLWPHRPVSDLPPVDAAPWDDAPLRRRGAMPRFIHRALWRLAYLAVIIGIVWAAMPRVEHGTAPAPRVTVERSATRQRVVASRVRLRRSPSPTAPVVAELRPGDRVVLLSVTSTWAQVRTLGGRTGYLPRSSIHTLEYQRRHPR
jgi:hypothetical protein